MTTVSWPYKTGFCGNRDHHLCSGIAGSPGREAICACHCHDANATARRRAELEAYEAGRDEEAVEAAVENMPY